MKNAPTVFVGLSGGVDSSVAAWRLLERGFNVVGVFIKVWHPDWLKCNWEEERLDAMRVAAHLQIPFLTCDAETAYRDEVAKYFIAEYLAGRTPNPDVMCNKQIKFGVFMKFAKQHMADFIATGHYVRRVEGEHGPELHRGIDNDKDQSYFLWSLTKEQIDYSLFPIGDTIKEGIRREATLAGIPTALKKDSQGICFLGHIDIREFLSHYTELKPGKVLDLNGKTIGEHHGSLIYTIGQRHGFTINTKESAREAYYVVNKNLEANTLTVSHSKPQTLATSTVTLTNINLTAPLKIGEVIEAEARYRQKPFSLQIDSMTDETLTLLNILDIDKLAIGQSCVLYKGSHCLGGGIIS